MSDNEILEQIKKQNPYQVEIGLIFHIEGSIENFSMAPHESGLYTLLSFDGALAFMIPKPFVGLKPTKKSFITPFTYVLYLELKKMLSTLR